MAVNEQDIAFVTDLFADLGPVTCRKMFGGLGVYLDGTIFAVKMSDGTLRLKGAGDMSAAYDDAGWEKWTYTRKDGAASSMPYWTIPDALLDDPEACCDWARQALSHL
jgi:DNA transformation protein